METLGMLIAICMVTALFIGLALLIRRDKRPLGAKLLLGSLACFPAIVLLAIADNKAAREAGWTSTLERNEASEAGFSDPKLWHAKIEADNEQAAREAGWSSSGDREEARLAGFLDPKAWKGYREAKANAERVLAAMAERDAAERAAVERAAAIEVAKAAAAPTPSPTAADTKSELRWQVGCNLQLRLEGIFLDTNHSNVVVVDERRWRALTYEEKKKFADQVNCAIAGPGYSALGLEFRSNMTNNVLGAIRYRGLYVVDN